MKKAAVLQSGFLTTSDAEMKRTPPEESEDRVKSIILGKLSTGDVNPFLYVKSINDVFVEYQSDGTLMQKFDYREKVLKAVKDCIPEGNFLEWCRLQEDSPYLSAMHKRMVRETLLYVFTGKQRLYPMESMARILTTRNTTEADRSFEYKVTALWRECTSGNGNLKEVVSSWCSKPGGFSDMLYFFAIVFGKHEGLVNI